MTTLSADSMIQVRVRCAECGGAGATEHPLWKAYREHRQSLGALDAAAEEEKVFDDWWRPHGFDMAAEPPVCPPSEAVECDCGTGWLLQWVSLDTLARRLREIGFEQSMLAEMNVLRAGVGRG